MSDPPAGTDEGAAAPAGETEAKAARPPGRGASAFAPHKALSGAVNAIAHELKGGPSRKLDGKLSPGDVAALRRLERGAAPPRAFWRIVVAHLEPARLLVDGAGPLRDDPERRWAVILGGMAHCAGLHQPGESLGRGLARAKLAEVRFARLLRAGGDALAPELRAVSHQLASSATHVDWAELADLVLSDGRPWAEEVRRRIARDYYGELYRAERPTNEGDAS